MANINVAGLIKEAGDAITARDEARDKVSALRELLRFSIRAGEATEEQAAWVDEAFPTKERKTAAEREQELLAQLAKVRAKGADEPVDPEDEE